MNKLSLMPVVYAGLVALWPSTLPELRQQTSTVRGVVFDSLTMRPAAGASVWVAGGTQITTTDSAGRFEIRGVERGKRFFEFSSRAIDSLALGTLGTQIDVQSDNLHAVLLATPAFATVWRTMCKDQLAKGDSGIVWGTIRDAATDTRLHGARTQVTWTEPRLTKDKNVEMDQHSREVLTDSSGNFYACGLPVGTELLVQGSGKQSLSGIVKFVVGGRNVARLDLLVSTEMVSGHSLRDSARVFDDVTALPKGTASVRGNIRDDKEQFVSGVTITSTGSDSTALSGGNGDFVMQRLRAGTQLVEVRKIGYQPARVVVDLRPDTTAEVSLSMVSTVELAPVDVKAERFMNRHRIEFEERRLLGIGYALREKDFVTKYDMQSVLSMFPNITARRTNKGSTVFLPCTPIIWLDGVRSSEFDGAEIHPSRLRAIEWYPPGRHAPLAFTTTTNRCGVLLVWSKHALWGDKR